MRNTITRLSVLVLAVICLSCKKEYCPAFQGTGVGLSIAILHADDCLMDGQLVSPDRVYDFGFQINSWSGDDTELSRLVVQFNGEVVCDTAINGTELLYKGRVSTYGISGEAEIVANVVDVFRRRGRGSIKILVGESQPLPY